MNEQERLEAYEAMCKDTERVQEVLADALAEHQATRQRGHKPPATPTVVRRALLRQAVQLSLDDPLALQDITATLVQLEAALREAAAQHLTIAEALNRAALAALPMTGRAN